MKKVLSLPEAEFNLFRQLLIEESGLCFEQDRGCPLIQALDERMQKRGYSSYQEYYHLLKFHPERRQEINELLDLITIGETHFFRNRPQFDGLVKLVLPQIVQRKAASGDKSIRAWSAGCSRGDEPYSIAMAVMEIIPDYQSWNISILGTDINRDALAYAKGAIYENKDIRYMPQTYLEKYFQRRGTSYILDEEVKKLVYFIYHNLAKDEFSLAGMKNLDIIFCRNVTIYFDFPTTRRIIEKFYQCLATPGYLFVGHSESLWQITNKFEAFELPQSFIYKKALHPAEEKAMKPFMGVPKLKLEELFPPGEEKQAPSETEKELESMYQEATRLFNEKKYEQASLLFDKIIAADKNHIRAYFAKASILANQEKYKEAIDALAKLIQVDNLYAQAYYLWGVLLYKTGNLKEAERQFRKVIYADPSIVLAYFNLGNIYLLQKRFNQAGREFNNAVKLLGARPEEEQVKFCEDFTVGFLIRACKNNILIINSKQV